MQGITHSNPKSKNPKGLPVSGGGHVIGYVRGDTFYRIVSGAVQFLKMPPALAFSPESLDQAEALGAVKVDIEDRDKGRHYLAGLAVIRAKGFEIDRGYGLQIACPLKNFSVTGGDSPVALNIPDRQGPTQARLF
jgi:hypothetical protein